MKIKLFKYDKEKYMTPRDMGIEMVKLGICDNVQQGRRRVLHHISNGLIKHEVRIYAKKQRFFVISKEEAEKYFK